MSMSSAESMSTAAGGAAAAESAAASALDNDEGDEQLLAAAKKLSLEPGKAAPSPAARRARRPRGRRSGRRGDRAGRGSAAAAPPLAADALPPLPSALLRRPHATVAAFGDAGSTWVAADWHESKAPRSYSGFFLPLIYSGLGPDAVACADAHWAGKPRATASSIAAVQPFWAAVFSHWSTWTAAVGAASAAGLLVAPLGRGTSAKAAALLPKGLGGIDAFAFGAVPHLKPAAQNDVIEQALGRWRARASTRASRRFMLINSRVESLATRYCSGKIT